MSITHINYDKTQKAIQITLRVFIDDLQTEMNSVLKTKKIELATSREPDNIDTLYHIYLKEKFKIELNSREKEVEYLGKKYKDDLVIFYLEIPNISEIKTIQIENHILYNTFSEQKNIVKTNINKKQKSHILTKNNTSAFINY